MAYRLRQPGKEAAALVAMDRLFAQYPRYGASAEFTQTVGGVHEQRFAMICGDRAYLRQQAPDFSAPAVPFRQ